MKKLLNKIIDFSLLRRVMRLVKPYKKRFYVAVAIAVATAVLAPVIPYIVQITIDKYIIGGNSTMLYNMTYLLLAILFVQAFLSYNFTYSTNLLGQSIVRDLRTRVFSHVLSLNLRHFDRTPIGTSVTRTISDVEAVNDIFAEGIITILSDLLTLIAVLIMMFYSSWQLSLVTLSVLPLLLVAAYIFKEGIRISFTDVRNQVARLNAFLNEHITGMNVVQIFNAEEREMKKFKGINLNHRTANIKSIWYYSVFFPVVEIISAMAVGLLVWYVSYKALDATSFVNTQDRTPAGMIIMFVMYLNLMFRPIRMLADKFNTLQMGMVASERVFKLIDNKDQMRNEGKLLAENMAGAIDFENVWFAYNEEDFVLKNVSFNVEAGKTLAIVGATGAGKSSVINILNRFYEIQEGEISIDGRSISDYQLAALRSKIGLVLQDVFLFSGSIMDNITLRNPLITQEQVKHAAEVCGVAEWIEKLPGGYNYNVMERGNSLSAGQRQLISFVRALVFDPRILILDEATSSIDTESEQLIQQAIEKLIEGRTSIIIAHRLSTIQHADKIMVLDKGEVKEIGNHNELMELNGYYRKLYELQFVKKEQVA
ncbi:MAG: ABC transporter ATP-binding protein/permease [Chitinophagales bacterium]|nr:ABC transporter ATP-binding protein/permease [Chitinophagales bacterium]